MEKSQCVLTVRVWGARTAGHTCLATAVSAGPTTAALDARNARVPTLFTPRHAGPTAVVQDARLTRRRAWGWGWRWIRSWRRGWVGSWRWWRIWPRARTPSCHVCSVFSAPQPDLAAPECVLHVFGRRGPVVGLEVAHKRPCTPQCVSDLVGRTTATVRRCNMTSTHDQYKHTGKPGKMGAKSDGSPIRSAQGVAASVERWTQPIGPREQRTKAFERSKVEGHVGHDVLNVAAH